jgi:hypothetical protein
LVWRGRTTVLATGVCRRLSITALRDGAGDKHIRVESNQDST